MGSWGHGNFQNDTAADHLSILTARLLDEIKQAMADPEELEPDEYWGVAVPCNIELLCVLAEQDWVGVALPSSDEVDTWRTTYIEVWEGYIDELEPTPEARAKRRAILDATFDRLAAAVQREESD
jgi:hypothetical protein